MKNWFVCSMMAVVLSASGLTTEAQAQRQSIVDVAIAANEATGEFSTLIAAVVAADLVDTLDGFRRYTVFAPTDAAFAKLGLNAGNVVLAPKKELRNILLYHVTNGKRFSGSVLNARFLRMANGETTRVSVSEAGAFINQSKLLAPDLIDIEASNGVIHVIDTVLAPSFLR